MSAATAADEFAAYVSGPKVGSSRLPHPEDRIPSSPSSPRSGSPSSSSSSSPSKGRQRQASQSKQQDHHHVRPGFPDRYHHSFNDANTGPKGVLADARAYERALQEARQKPSSALNTSTIVNGGVGNRNGGPWPFSRADSRNPSQRPRRRNKANSNEDDADGKMKGGSGDEKEEEEEEDEFMDRWRHDRLNQLRNTSTNIITTNNSTPTTTTKSGRRSSPSLRRYGSVESVDAFGYLDAIERVGRDTIVVVYIYDDQVKISSPIIKQPYSIDGLMIDGFVFIKE